MSKKNVKTKKTKRRNILNTVIIVLLSLVLVGSVGGFVVLGKIVDAAPTLNLDQLDSKENTKIYDNQGNVVYELGMESRENIEYEDIPQVVIDAFLSIEDSRFFRHNGFDIPRFIKAGLENLRAGNFAQGGSTLTMQLIDNVYFANMEPSSGAIESVVRKVQEIFMSMEVETKLSKEEILSLYLNKINFGGAARGIQKGALYYFGKDITQVNLSEAAFLAGVINAPNAFNPYFGYDPETGYSYYDAAIERRNTTLDLMLYHGYISETEHALAKSTELAFQLKDEMTLETDPLLSYIDVVVQEVRELTGEDPYLVPMDIYTNMDLGAQQLADDILNGKVTYPNGDQLFQVGFSLINNQTGEIIALGGGRGYGGEERHNRGFDLRKQPGSSIKPLVDYVLAFDYLGYATSHVFEDIPTVYRNTDILLQNAGGGYRGDVEFKTAVGLSLNTSAYKSLEGLVDKLGVSRVVELLNLMGLEIKPEEFDLGYSIGGSNFALSPTQLAGAYQIFANGGKYIEPHTVKSVTIRETAEEIMQSYEPVQVVSPQAAYLMSTLLYDAVQTNYGNLLQILIDSYPVYGKTGTSDWAKDGLPYGIPETAMKDKWMVSYTSNYTVAAWAGYDVPVAGMNTYFDNAKMALNVPGQINNLLLDYTTTISSPRAIARPSGVVSINHVKGTFPYAAIPEGASESLGTTGLIKSEFANLVGLDVPQLETLDKFDAKYDEKTQSLNINFSPYPEADMLLPFDGKQTWNLYGIKGSGVKYFDERLIYGNVGYFVDIYTDGQLKDTIAFEKDVIETSIAFPAGSDIKLCGYYGFTINKEIKSNQICVDFKTEKANSAPVINGVRNQEVTLNTPFNPLAGISASDAEDGDLTSKISVSGNVNTSVAGTYELTYTVKDSKGESVSAKAVITVKPQDSNPDEDSDESDD